MRHASTQGLLTVLLASIASSLGAATADVTIARAASPPAYVSAARFQSAGTARGKPQLTLAAVSPVSYTHLTLPTNREV